MSTDAARFTHRLFHEFFPPPKFLEMPAVGLDISDAAVTVLELVRRRDGFEVGRFGRRPLPSGTIAGGYVNNRERVIAELTGLKNALGLQFVNASLSEEKAYLFKTRIPLVPEKEVRGAIEFKLEEHVPISAAEAVFDYTLVAQEGHAPPDHQDVSVTVLPRKAVDTYIELLAAAGLVPLSFEIEAQAIAQAVIRAGDRGVYLIVNIGEEKTGLFIVSDGTVSFTSTVAVGSRILTGVAAKRLSASEAGVAHERAAFPSSHAGSSSPLHAAAAALKDEVNKLAIYWRTHEDAGGDERPHIKKIILTGHDACLPGFDEALALSIPVEVGNVWQNVCSFDEYIPPIPLDVSLDYAAAVGLALPKGH